MISGIFEILSFSIKKAESLLQLDVLLYPEKKDKLDKPPDHFPIMKYPRRKRKKAV